MGVPSGARICMRKRLRAVSFLEAHHHGFKETEGFLLVLDEGILLAVAAEADAFFEVIHVEEMLFPEGIEYGEHDDAFVVAELRVAEDLFLDVVALIECVEDGVAELVAVELRGVDGVFEARAEDVVDLGEDLFGVPLLGVGFLGSELVEDVGEDGGDVVFGDELLLGDAFHELAAEGIDGLALLVHDVVVLEDVFCGTRSSGSRPPFARLRCAWRSCGIRWGRLLPCRATGGAWRPTRGRRCA